MDIIIQNNGERPIYEQIVAQIKHLILTGELKEGDPLPSMRHLAKELRISVITTKRAYEELERQGFTQSVVGKGSFVSCQNPALIREEHLRQIESHLQAAAEMAHTAGISLEELMESLTILYQEEL